MDRGTFTFAALVAAFVVYTTLKGNLRRYLEIMGIV